MKARIGFVSNSSSSSFVLAATGPFKSMTKAALVEGLKKVYKDYDKEVRESVEWYENDDWAKENYVRCDEETGMEYSYKSKRSNGYAFATPFQVYDMMDERDRRIAETNRALWESWIDTIAVKKNGRVVRDDGHLVDKWYEYAEEKRDNEYDDFHLWLSGCTPPSEIAKDFDNPDSNIAKMTRYNHDLDRWEDRPLPDEVKNKIREFVKKGLISNWDAASSKQSRFLIHFDDNEIYEVKWDGDEHNPDPYDMSLMEFCEAFARIGGAEPPQDDSALIAMTLHEG